MTLRLATALLTLSLGLIPLVLMPGVSGVAAQTNDDLPSLSVARGGLGVAAVNGKLYAISGYSGVYTGLVEEYAPSTPAWIPKASLPFGRADMAVASDGARIYVVGGQGSNSDLSLDIFDPAANAWTSGRSLSRLRMGFGAAAIGGKVYAVGGTIGGYVTLSSLVEEYDPSTNVWRSRASMPTARVALSVVASNGKLYAIGGDVNTWSVPNPDTTIATVEEYDPVSDTWRSRASMHGARRFFGAVAASNGKIYVMGGLGTDRAMWNMPINTVEEYDPAADTWRTRASMPTARYQFGVAEGADGRLYAVGGFNNGTIISSVEAYDPATNEWRPDRYPPTIQSLAVNQGAASTNSPNVTLALQASDIGSGLGDMRFSNDGTTWSDWEPFSASKSWALSPGPDGTRTVQTQVRDRLGGVSAVAADTILYDTTPPTVAAVSINAGALATTSTAASLSLQASDQNGGSGVSEMAFSNDGGATWSTWEPYASPKAWTLSPGDGPKTVQARVRDAAGNVSSSASDAITLDTAVGASFGITIDNAAVWTNTVAVTLSIPAAPRTARMMLSNDGSFPGAQWELYDSHKAWVLDRFEGSPVTMIVYVRFGDASGNELPNSRSSDNIVLDVDPPSGSVAIAGGSSPGGAGSPTPNSPVRTVQLTASDTQSGAAMQMRLSNRADFAGAIWKPFVSSVSWDFTGGNTVYAQFKDGAGNVSQVYSQTIAGGVGPGPSGVPNCSPRPRVGLELHHVNGTLVATVAVTGANNGLRAIRFDSFANAVVDAGDQRNQTSPFAVSIPAGQEPTALQFTVKRQTAGAATTVRLVVVDGCGEWSTFVGGGPGAF